MEGEMGAYFSPLSADDPPILMVNVLVLGSVESWNSSAMGSSRGASGGDCSSMKIMKFGGGYQNFEFSNRRVTKE